MPASMIQIIHQFVAVADSLEVVSQFGRPHGVRRHHPVDPEMRGKAYRAQGWTSFDERAEPYTASELERERTLHRTDASR